MMRYALVRGLGCTAAKVAAYLPRNYRVLWEGDYADGPLADHVVVIAGRDRAGWTLDGYVIPRLGSGLLRADEIDLSHPVTRRVPA